MFGAFQAIPVANWNGSDTRIETPVTNGGSEKERKRERRGKERTTLP